MANEPTLRRFAADDPRFCLEYPLPYLEEADVSSDQDESAPPGSG